MKCKMTIKADIPERDFMESCLNQAHQLNQDMTIIIIFYAFAHGWHIDKLLFLMNECGIIMEKKDDE